MTTDTPSKTVAYKGTSLGIGTGNAFAYFGLEYLKKYQDMTFDDPVVAMAMAGAVVSVLFLQIGKVVAGVKYIFDRVFPAKNK